ncbi:MAG: FHA domain-containing protein [Chloroflexi bacterium]|nr:FHA domain-containing protein [Chloroflexota bacterium]
MPSEGLTVDAALLGLRIAFALLLYLFVFRVIAVLRHGLEEPPVAAAEAPATPVSAEGGALVVVDGSEEYAPGTAFAVEPLTLIGRSDEAAVPLHDSTISAEHALVTLQRGALYIEDRGSRNGTFVNRARVDGPTRLNFGDVIQVGRVRLKLVRT